jgi:very-short-patch-repair endonuclease
MIKNNNLNKFIEKSINIHGGKYDYSLVDYVNARTKVKIICPIHDIFEQTPDTHSRGTGCPECGGSKKLTTDSFTDKANMIHKGKYDYSNVNYINNSTKVKIICPIHDIFEQTPSDHLKYGCWHCGVYVRSNKKRLTNSEFINKANDRHNGYYNYSKVIYTGHRNKVTIICPKHGEFIQKANAHLNGQGCPSCKKSLGENKIESWLVGKNIKFKPQHRFKDCRDIRPLPFDFYLSDYNICIEYDGAQHFIPNMFNNKSDINDIIKKDNIKTNYCTINNIKLIRIKYTEFGDIDKILGNFIS